MSKTSLRKPVVVVGIAALSLLLAVVRVFILPGVDIAGLHYKVFGDSFWLIRNAYLSFGAPVEEATRRALEIFLPLANGPVADLAAAVNEKLPIYMSISPRYTAIFESRPLPSLVLAPFLVAFGGGAISWVIATELAIAGFLAAALSTRLISKTLSNAPLLGVLALAAFYILPTGEWGSAILFEGFSYIFAIGLVLLALNVLQKSQNWRIAIWFLGPIAVLGLAAKSSMLMPVVIFSMVPFVWRAFQHRGRDAAMNISIAILGGALVLWSILGAVMKWPGVGESLQDTFTDHFNRPDVTNPLQLWSGLIKTSVKGEILWAIDNPAIPIAFILVLLLTMQRFGLASVFLLGFVVSGLGQFFVHPEPSEFERFFAVGWLAVVVAVPTLLLELFQRNKAMRLLGYVPWRKSTQHQAVATSN